MVDEWHRLGIVGLEFTCADDPVFGKVRVDLPEARDELFQQFIRGEIEIFMRIKPLIILECNVMDIFQYPMEGGVAKGTFYG